MIRRDASLGRLREQFDAVLLDMDGTLLDDHGQVTRRTHRAVRQLADAGLMVVLCTGRSPQGVSEVHDDLGLETPIVAYNGSWIGPAGGEPERMIDLAPERVHDLAPVEARADFGFRHEATTKWTVASEHADHPSVAAWYSNVRFAQGWHEMPLHGLLRMTLFFDLPVSSDGGPPPHESAWSVLSPQAAAQLRRETFPLSLFRPYRHSRLHMLEIQAASRGKAEALVWLAEQHGVPAERAIAIGDHVNDLPMLEAAGLAIAMGNAVPEAKAHADLVLASNDEDGIAQWVEQGAPLPTDRDTGEHA